MNDDTKPVLDVLWQWNPPALLPKKRRGSPVESSTTTHAPSFYDKHLGEGFVLKYIRHVPSLCDILMDQVEKHFENASTLPESTSGLFTKEYIDSFVEAFPRTVYDEQGVAECYRRNVFFSCCNLVSTLALYPGAKKWRSILSIEQERGRRPIADRRLEFKIKIDAVEAWKCVTPAVREAIAFMEDSTDWFVATFEHLYLTAETEQIFEELLSQARANALHGIEPVEFGWTFCNMKEKGRKCPRHEVLVEPVCEDDPNRLWRNFVNPIIDTKNAALEPQDSTYKDPDKDAGPPPTAPGDVTSEFLLQHTWVQAAMHNVSFILISAGNYEVIAIRDRGTQTLYVSDLIEPAKYPGYLKLQVGFYISAIKDLFHTGPVWRTCPLPPLSTLCSSHSYKGQRLVHSNVISKALLDDLELTQPTMNDEVKASLDLIFECPPPLLIQEEPELCGTDSYASQEPAFYDKHLAERFVLKYVKYMPQLGDILTAQVDSQIRQADTLPTSADWLPRRKTDILSSWETIARSAFNEEGVERFYERIVFHWGSRVASTVALHPKSEEWRSILALNPQHSAAPIADATIMIQCPPKVPDEKTWDSSLPEVKEAVEFIKNFIKVYKKPKAWRLLTIEFKSLVVGKLGVFIQILRDACGNSVVGAKLVEFAWHHNATFMLISAGNYEVIAIRDREKQTLYLSDLIEPSKYPGYMKLQVGFYISAIKDLFARLECEKGKQADTGDGGDGEGEEGKGDGGDGSGSSNSVWQGGDGDGRGGGAEGGIKRRGQESSQDQPSKRQRNCKIDCS
ncbi:hypothetical protein BD410DRAFT_899238 [Rickenella mellea]|uniref:Uncharacterized protein n=1 Tax=Rickenella mellea TaxID=50990 RepID=A0A4Y7PZZ0_9AGAM|nr:hypothetical protein BD410DRAFT_899238 [Rickenella mellea]